LALLVDSQWRVPSWDVETAFLHGNPLTCDVFIVPLPGFAPDGHIWKLLKPIYGLVSGPKSWYDRLISVARGCGLDTNLSDDGILVLRNAAEQTVGAMSFSMWKIQSAEVIQYFNVSCPSLPSTLRYAPRRNIPSYSKDFVYAPSPPRPVA
jgi:hypothetical protein